MSTTTVPAVTVLCMRFAILVWFSLQITVAALFADHPQIEFKLPADAAERSLRRLSAQSGVQVLFPTEISRGVRTRAFYGSCTLLEAVERLLAGTPLVAEFDGKMGILIVRRSPVVHTSPISKTRSFKPEETTLETFLNEDIRMSAFVVSSVADKGYSSRQTLIGARSAADVQDIPASISIIGRELMDDLSVSTMQDALRFGVSGITQNVRRTEDQSIRGFRSGFSLRDGKPKYNYKNQPMYDVDRLEVIKGPLAMLLATNDLGGGVNAVTKQPSDHHVGSVEATVGNDEYVRWTVNESNRIFYRSPNSRAAYRLTLGGTSSQSPRATEYVRELFLGGAVSWQITEAQSLNVAGHVFSNGNFEYFGDFLDIKSTGAARLNRYSTPTFTVSRTEEAAWPNRDVYVDATYLIRVGEGGDLRANFSLSRNRNRAVLVRGTTVADDNITLNRQVVPISIGQDPRLLQVDYQQIVPLKLATLTFNTGMSYLHRQEDQAQSFLPLSPLDTSNPNFSADERFFAATDLLPGWGLPHLSDVSNRHQVTTFYVQPQFKLWKERLILVGGFRWIYPTVTTTHRNTGQVTRSSRSDTRTHKFGIVYQPMPGFSLYVTDVMNRYPRNGVLRPPEGDDPGELFKDQAGQLYEAGLKFDRHLSSTVDLFGSLAGFDQFLTHVQTFSNNPAGEPIKVQSERDRVRGFEVDLGMRWEFSHGHTDILATYYEANPRRADGLQVVDAPRTVLSLLVKHSWTAGRFRGLMLGAGIYDQDARPAMGTWIDFPTTYYLFARYAFGRSWNVQLNLDNVTDERYVLGGPSSGMVDAATPFQPRLRVKYAW